MGGAGETDSGASMICCHPGSTQCVEAEAKPASTPSHNATAKTGQGQLSSTLNVKATDCCGAEEGGELEEFISELMDQTAKVLKGACRERELPLTGNKRDLAKRLALHNLQQQQRQA